MDRRVVGAWLLVAVLIAAAVVPNLHGHRLVGTPVAVSVPPPPSPGDCLLIRPRPSSPPQGAQPDGSQQEGTLPNVVAPGHLAPCTGSHFGEVAMVVPDGAPDLLTLPMVTTCMDVSSYLGRVPSVPAPLGGLTAELWYLPFGNSFGSWTGPTPLQRAAGQKWAACLLVPPDWHRPATPEYTGSARQAFATGVLPSVFAICWSTGAVPQNQIPCDQPHPTELLAYAPVVSGVTAQQLEEGCRRLATTFLRRTDLTAAGALTVHAVSVHYSSTTGGSSPGLAAAGSADQSESFCVATVTGRTLLHGSLIGIGNGALPWSG